MCQCVVCGYLLGWEDFVCPRCGTEVPQMTREEKRTEVMEFLLRNKDILPEVLSLYNIQENKEYRIIHIDTKYAGAGTGKIYLDFL